MTINFHGQESLLIDCASLTYTAQATADDNDARQYNSHACNFILYVKNNAHQHLLQRHTTELEVWGCSILSSSVSSGGWVE
jgi:hypothetical protein